ncbi:DUF1761 domain-containing protein [Patescibacteria group bacterium]|nr:DUF1761 domain-containing protein [Patescibacteria group bacterium]
MEMPINYIAILVSAAVMFGVGALWYSPLLFVKPWMKYLGITQEGMKSMSMTPIKAMSIGFITSLISAYILYRVSFAFGVIDVWDAITVGFWMWLGFAAPISMHSYLWEGKPIQLLYINLPYLLISICLGAVVQVLL